MIELGVGLGDICPPISQLVLKNLIKMSLIIKECPEEIVINMAIVLKISKSSWSTAVLPFEAFCILYRGYCNRCQKRLNRADLTKKEFKELRDVFLDSTLHEGDSLYWSKPEEVERFKKFLQEHNKFDVVIDSLNVVYATRHNSGLPKYKVVNII